MTALFIVMLTPWYESASPFSAQINIPVVHRRDHIPVVVLFSRYQTWHHIAAGDLAGCVSTCFVCACVACACDAAGNTSIGDMAGECGCGRVVFCGPMM